MGLGTGGIISFGGGGGTGSGGGSGIQSINGQTGPNITVNGVNGARVLVGGANILTVDVSPLSGIIPVTSGIESVNGDAGPHINFIGVNGIGVSALGGGDILLDGVGISGTTGSVNKFAANFTNVVSGQFNHGLGTREIIVQVYETSPIDEQITPDSIVLESNNVVSIVFNGPQSGRIVVIG